MAGEHEQDETKPPHEVGPPEASDEATVDYRLYVVAPRSLEVFHPDGHRWNFQFPEGFSGGEIKMFAPIRWAKDVPPADLSISDTAALLATAEAKRQGWI